MAPAPPFRGIPWKGFSAVAVRCLETAAILVMAVEVVVVLAGVFFRYILNRPIAGSDEIADLLLVWLTFIGGAAAQRRRSHPSVSIFVQRLSSAVVPYLDAITRLVEVVFFVFVCWYSVQLFRLRLGEPSAGAGFDMGLYPGALVLGATISFLFAVGQLAAVPRRPLADHPGGHGGGGWSRMAGHARRGLQPRPYQLHGLPHHRLLRAPDHERAPRCCPRVPGHALPVNPGGTQPHHAPPAAYRRGRQLCPPGDPALHPGGGPDGDGRHLAPAG